jgi:hypothetical protein
MQKRHFEFVARVIADSRAEARRSGGGPQAFAILDRISEKFAEAFKHEAPRFQSAMFYRASGYLNK